MSRYIDADALVADTSFFDGDEWHYGYSAKQIENAPTVDAVQVVRCGECKYWEEESTFCLNKEGCYGSETTADFFCADGERRTE